VLSAADGSLIERDGQLPALTLLLDPAALLTCLRVEFPGRTLGDLVPTYLRYKPKTSCLAGFRLRVDGATILLSMTARRPDALEKLEKMRVRPGVSGALGAGRTLIPGLALVISVFPNDRVLTRLWKLFDVSQVGAILNGVGLPPSASVTALRFRPERRFVARIDDERVPIAVLKLCAPDEFERCARNARAFASTDKLVIPRWIGAASRTGAIASEWLAGSCPAPDIEVASAIGAALATLHDQHAPDLNPLTADEQIASAHSTAEDLGLLLPGLAERARRVAIRIKARLVLSERRVPIHGDCHLEQFVVDGSRIALVDFDEAVCGPAAWDLANLLAHLEIDPAQSVDLAAFRRALLDGYRSARGEVADDALDTQWALALLRLALRPFRERQSDWPVAIARILDRVEALLPDPLLPRLPDPALPQMRSALDPVLATASFVANGFPVSVHSTRLVRHKSGRRCLIAYELSRDCGPVIRAFGKLRAKGADHRTYAMHRALRESGLKPGGIAAVCVAEPLALVPELGLWLQASVPGQPFRPDLCSPERAALAIGALHAATVRPSRQHLIDDELAILENRFSAFADRRPQLRTRLCALVSTARNWSSKLDPVLLRPVHRDFYPDHLLCDGKTLHLIDLDLVSLGDPAVDIGNFNAHLTEQSLRVQGDPHRFLGWQTRFAGAACRPTNGPRRDHVEIYEFLSLVRLIEIADRMPERRDSVAALISYCETISASGPERSRSNTWPA